MGSHGNQQEFLEQALIASHSAAFRDGGFCQDAGFTSICTLISSISSIYGMQRS